jgi:hypothetical protein
MMDDEVAWSKAKTQPLKGFEDAQRQPVPLLLGLTLGLVSGWMGGALSPVLAPLPPLIVGGVLTFIRKTQAVGLGMIAAACGIVTFLVTGFLLLAIF